MTCSAVAAHNELERFARYTVYGEAYYEYALAKNVQPGIMMLFQLGWLPYERFQKLHPASLDEHFSKRMKNGRSALTLDELLSTDWDGYNEEWDDLLKTVERTSRPEASAVLLRPPHGLCGD